MFRLSSQPTDEVDVPFQEVVGRQGRGRVPQDLREIKILRFTGVLRHMEEQQGCRALRTGVTEFVRVQLRAYFGFNGEFFAQFPLQGGARLFARLHLAAWKLPLERMFAARLALADEDAPVALNDGGHHYQRRHYLPASARSMALVSSFDSGSTGASNRASTLPLRSTRYLVKFHGIGPPVVG